MLRSWSLVSPLPFQPCVKRGTVEQIDLRAELDVGLEPGRPVGARVQAGERIRPRCAIDRRRRSPRRCGSPSSACDDPAGAVRVVERERALEARSRGSRRLRRSRARARASADRLSSEPSSTTSQRDAAVRIARVPFVVVRISVRAFGALRRTPAARRRRRSPRRRPRSARRRRRPRRRARPAAPRLVDLGAAEHTLVAGCERLRDRRRRADHVDDDPDARGGLLLGREGDVDAHRRYASRVDAARATATATPTARPGSRARSAVVPSVTSA